VQTARIDISSKSSSPTVCARVFKDREKKEGSLKSGGVTLRFPHAGLGVGFERGGRTNWLRAATSSEEGGGGVTDSKRR